MSGYTFKSDNQDFVHVPRHIINSFLPIASGVQIKVLLCLVGFENMSLSAADIAKHCNAEEQDVKKSVEFWVKNGVLLCKGSKLSFANTQMVLQPQTLPKYTPQSILLRKEQDNDFAFLLDETQRVLGKIVTTNDVSVLYGIYDHLGFKPELILQMISFCVSVGKTGFRYLEKVAIDWHDRGIDSFEKAESYICALEKSRHIQTAVSTYFGIENRSLSKREKEYIDNWTSSFKMSIEMIKQAYEVCVDTKGKLSFAYINGILSDWFKKGYKKVSDIQKDKSNSAEKSYDMDEIEQAVLMNMLKD